MVGLSLIKGIKVSVIEWDTLSSRMFLLIFYISVTT